MPHEIKSTTTANSKTKKKKKTPICTGEEPFTCGPAANAKTLLLLFYLYPLLQAVSSLYRVLSTHNKPDKSTKNIAVFKLVRIVFFRIVQNARRSPDRVGALALTWIRVGVRVKAKKKKKSKIVIFFCTLSGMFCGSRLVQPPHQHGRT